MTRKGNGKKQGQSEEGNKREESVDIQASRIGPCRGKEGEEEGTGCRFRVDNKGGGFGERWRGKEPCAEPEGRETLRRGRVP